MRWVLALVVGFSFLATAQTPLKRGMELRYSGEAKLQQGQQSITASVQVIDLVTEVAEKGQATVASLRVFQPQIPDRPIPPEAALRFLDISVSGEEAIVPFEQVVAESPPFPFLANFSRVLPIYFVPLDRLQAGKEWATKERLLLRPEVDAEVRYQVQGQEKVGDTACWLVTRSLPKPVPVPDMEGVQFAKIADSLWVNAQTGLVVRLKREGMLQLPQGALTATIQLDLQSVKPLDEATFAQRLKELQAIKVVQQKLGINLLQSPTKEGLDAAENAIAEFQRQFKDSPYLAYLQTWLRIVQSVRQGMERAEKQGAAIGQPAPDFELPTVDGKRKVKLSDLKGKVVVLNFFAHW
jgi:hypothetical protein